MEMDSQNINALTKTEQYALRIIAENNGLATFVLIWNNLQKSENTIHRIVGKLICLKLIGAEIYDGKVSFFKI